MDYDKILLKIGEFGLWQKKALLVLTIPAFIGGLVVMTTAFTTQMPDVFSCNIPECDKYVTSEGHLIKKTKHNYHNFISSLHKEDIHGKPDYCFTEKLKVLGNNTCTKVEGGEKYECDEKSTYHYNPDAIDMKSTVITHNKAYCEQGVKAYKPACNTFFMVGFLLGGSLFGTVADTFGRKIAVTMAIMFAFVGSLLGPLVGAPSGVGNHWAYAVTRIIPGAGSIGAYLMAFTLAVEIIGKEQQLYGIPWNMTIFSFVANMIAVPYALGEASNGLLAYIFNQWWSLDIVVTFICGISCFVWFCIPESPRWLIEKKKFKKAKKLVKQAANINKKEVKEEDFLNVDNVEEADDSYSIISAARSLKHGAGDAWSGKKGLFHPALKRTTIVLFLLWAVVTLVYYGLNFGIEELELTERAYLGVGIVAVVEIPSYIITAMLLDLLGRKPILIWSLLITSVSCFGACAVDDEGDVAKVLVLIAKFHISATFTVVRIYTLEIYPTSIRATALGSCKSFSALGAIASPWMGQYLPKTWIDGHFYALIFFGIISSISGLLSFFLADTVGFSLPNTFEDVQQIKMLQKPMFKIATTKWKPTSSNSDEREEGGDSDVV